MCVGKVLDVRYFAFSVFPSINVNYGIGLCIIDVLVWLCLWFRLMDCKFTTKIRLFSCKFISSDLYR